MCLAFGWRIWTGLSGFSLAWSFRTVKVKCGSYGCLATFCTLSGIRCLLSLAFAFLSLIFSRLLGLNSALIEYAINLA
jgi:hypothetical protein